MATLVTQLFGKTDREEEQRLESLFLNRAELKREFEQQRNIAEVNADKLRQQEIATLRAEQSLEKLESMLADPVSAYQAMAFYQLRALWVHGRKRLQRFSTELYETLAEEERAIFLRDHEANKNYSIQEIRDQLKEISQKGEALSAQMNELRKAREDLRGFWNFFRRRALNERIAEFDAARGLVTDQIQKLIDKTQLESTTAPPKFPGLSLEGKRRLNVTLIALAQELYLWFREDKLADMARESSICQVTDIRFGGSSECRALGRNIRERIKELALDNNLAVRVGSRADYLEQHIVEYRGQHDTIPESAGLFEVAIDVSKPVEIAPAPVNVLAMEYWGIYDVLVQ